MAATTGSLNAPEFGSLFSGIGGIDLGLERAGWSCSWQVEIDDYCRKVLTKHWPEVPKYGDIHAIDWRAVDAVELVAGGFPCQPFSIAGSRTGQDDDRWLWPEFARCVNALRPRWVLIENVPGLLYGGPLDDQSGGPVLQAGIGEVLGDLADLGYDAEWHRIPALAVGAPHLRQRIFIVAHAGGQRRQQDARGELGAQEGHAGRPALQDHVAERDGQGHPSGTVADADHAGRGQRRRAGAVSTQQSAAQRSGEGGGNGRPAESGFRGVVDGISPRLDQAGLNAWSNGEWPGVPRVNYGVTNRVSRLRGLGNAVVPQVVQLIGTYILALHEQAA